MRKFLFALLVAVLMLSACGGDDGGSSSDSGGSSLEDVTVEGEFGESPTLDVPEGFSVDATESTVVSEGDGETVEKGDTVNVNYLGVNAESGATFDSSFERGQPISATLDPAAGIIPGFVNGLIGQQVGSRVLVAIPPAEGYGEQGNPQAQIGGEDTIVFVVDIVARIPGADELPKSAEGTKQRVPSSMPELQTDKSGSPTEFAATPQTAEKVGKLQSVVAIKGDGPKVKSGQTLSVHYVGQIYPDGKVFDASWGRGEPASFSIGTGAVIPCWDKGLVGQTVGSRVYLVCPPEAGYGTQGNPQAGIKGSDTIIFAVDILGAF